MIDPRARTKPLTKPQRALLVALAGYPYHEGRVMPRARRTVRVLEDRGFVRWLVGGGDWYRVTPEGLAEVKRDER